MTGEYLAQQLASKKSLQEFLKIEDVQKALEAEDFEEVYFLAEVSHFLFIGQLHWLFEEAGINPWNYFSNYLPTRYFDTELILKDIKIPGRFKTIGELCFTRSESLEKVEFEEGVEYFAAGVFHNCRALKRVILPSSITHLPSYTFKGCTQLEEIEYHGDVRTARNDVFVRLNVLAESAVQKVICKDGELEVKDGKIVIEKP